jgi:hypothetical protein
MVTDERRSEEGQDPGADGSTGRGADGRPPGGLLPDERSTVALRALLGASGEPVPADGRLPEAGGTGGTDPSGSDAGAGGVAGDPAAVPGPDGADPDPFLRTLTDLLDAGAAGGTEVSVPPDPDRAVVESVLDGTADPPSLADTVPLGDACPDCGAGLRGRYDGDRFRVGCEDCSSRLFVTDSPPTGFAGREIGRVADCLRTDLDRVAGGRCSCGGATTAAVDETGDGHDVRFDCEDCRSLLRVEAETYPLLRPAGVAFCYETGLDLRTERPWAVRGRFDTATVADGDDLLVEYTADADSDAPTDVSLRVRIGPDGSVERH